ncbi:helix-turn-helix domain-containing protein [Schaedlerella arabinosiphila]|nr:helix-turn-helix transcriptional regulator [Schaedlerella arabinosiphila]
MTKNMKYFPMINKDKTEKRLELLMKWNHLQPKDLQIYLGLACVQTVYRWIKGINIPSVDHLYALSRLFQVNIDDMLVGNGDIVSTSIQHKTAFRFMMYYTQLKDAA